MATGWARTTATRAPCGRWTLLVSVCPLPVAAAWASGGAPRPPLQLRLPTSSPHSHPALPPFTACCAGDSKLLLTGSADQSVKLWDVATGRELFNFPHRGVVRSVAWAEGERQFATVNDPFGSEQPARISVFSFADNPSDQSAEAVLTIVDADAPRVRMSKVAWLPLNAGLLVGLETGALRVYDPVTGELKGEWKEHSGPISSFVLNEEKTLLLTSSHDRTAALWDVADMRVLKRYTADVPVNAAVLSPLKDHLILGGGQEAMSVTTTAVSAGKFESRFYHLVFATEMGRVKGHFGPINTLAFHPSGRAFASGAEDGFIRLHSLDSEYDGLGAELDGDLDDPALSAALQAGELEVLEREEEEAKAKEAEKQRAAAAAAGVLEGLLAGGGGGMVKAEPTRKEPAVGLIAALRAQAAH